MRLAAVEDRAVVGGQHIIEQGGVGAADRLALAGLDGAELKPALRHDRTQRSGADPGKADPGGDDQEESEPQRDGPAGTVGAMGGFGDGHDGVRR